MPSKPRLSPGRWSRYRVRRRLHKPYWTAGRLTPYQTGVMQRGMTRRVLLTLLALSAPSSSRGWGRDDCNLPSLRCGSCPKHRSAMRRIAGEGGVTHVVALSGGKDSTAMALRLREIEPRTYVYICTPTGHELPELEEHWHRLEQLLAAPLIRLTNGTLTSWIETWQSLPNFRMRWCTRVLKIQPMMAWLAAHAPTTHYVGLRADEETREGIYGNIAVTRYPLREWGWGLQEVRHYLRLRKLTIPSRTDCDLCFFQRVNEWKALLRRFPERWHHGERLEAMTGATFRTPGRDSWPIALHDFRKALEAQPALAFTAGTDEDSRAGMCRTCTL